MELVPLRREFAPAMAAGGPENDEVHRFTGSRATFGVEDYEACIERTLTDPNRYTRAIVENGKYLGEIVYRKCGFREEGRLRDVLLWDGVFHDAIVMSVLSTDNI